MGSQTKKEWKSYNFVGFPFHIGFIILKNRGFYISYIFVGATFL